MRRMMIALLLGIFGATGMAANWATLPEKQRPGFGETVVDLDSVRAMSDIWPLVEVTQRYGPSEVDLLLDCEEVSYTIRSQRSPSYDGKVMTLSRGSEHHYPSWRDAVVHRHICPRFIKSWDEEYFSPPTEFCSLKDSYAQQLCSGDRMLLGEFNLFEKRLSQLGLRCTIPKESKVNIQLFFMQEASQCKNEQCLGNVSRAMFSSMEKSLVASQAGKQCTFVDEQLAKIETTSQRKKAFSDHHRCLIGGIPMMDDKVSSAETIADALQARCKSILDAVLEQDLSNELQKNVRPKVVGLVLEYRAARLRTQDRQKSKSTKPKAREM